MWSRDCIDDSLVIDGNAFNKLNILLDASPFQGVPRAQRFVQDLIVTQLTGKLLDEMWEITNPMGLLVDIHMKQQKALPEPR